MCSKTLGPSVAQFTNAIVRTLEQYLEDIEWPDAPIEARLLFAQIDGLCQHYVLDPARYPLERVIERLDRALCRGAEPCEIALATARCTMWTKDRARRFCSCTARRPIRTNIGI